MTTFEKLPFPANRKMVAASAAISARKNTIHSITEVDVSLSRELIRNYHADHGIRLSFTAYLVACLAQTLKDHPQLNAWRRGGKLYQFDDVTISVLVERELGGERVPEPVVIPHAQQASLLQIHDRIRAAQDHQDQRMGGLTGLTWVRFIPGFLLKTFVWLAAHSLTMTRRYGVVGVTAIGMFGHGANWAIPLTNATVTLTIGSIVNRMVLVKGSLEEREHLCLTFSFDHDLVDGAPAARFIKDFSTTVSEATLLSTSSEEK